MTLTERMQQRPDRLPAHTVPMDERPERRTIPRWRERMDSQGLPVQDSTWRTTKEAA